MLHHHRICLAAGVLCIAASTVSAADIITLDVVPSTKEHPRHDHQLIFPLNDGRLMLVWSEYYLTESTKPGAQHDNMPCRISALFSGDRGRTWGDRRVLQENTGTFNVKHPNLLRLPSGEVLLFYTEWNSMEDRRVMMRRSTDDCRTWSEPQRVSILPGINNINNDHVLLLRSGRIVLPSFNSRFYGKGDHWTAFCLYSDDQARSWHMSDNSIDLGKRGAEEPMMIERRDGSLLALMRTSLGAVYQAESPDGGKTWSDATSTGLAAPASPPCVKRMPQTGDLLIVWNHNYDEGHHHQGARTPLSSAISRDDGKSWQNIRDLERVDGGAAAYAAVFFQNDEALVTYYYQQQGMGGQSGVRLKIVPVAWFYTANAH